MKNIFKKLFKKDKFKNIESITDNRSDYTTLHKYTMIGRKVKYTTPEMEDSSGVVIADQVNLKSVKRQYTVIDLNTMKLRTVLDDMVYDCSGIDQNNNFVGSMEIYSDVNQYCKTLCIMECNKECPLYVYKKKES